MKATLWLALGILLGLGLTSTPRAAPEAEQDRLAALQRQKRDAARKTFEVTWQNYREGRRGPESLYWWSRRWLESEQQLLGEKGDKSVAAQKHLERMKDLEKVIRDLQRSNIATVDEISAAEFYRSEAEIWLRQAKN